MFDVILLPPQVIQKGMITLIKSEFHLFSYKISSILCNNNNGCLSRARTQKSTSQSRVCYLFHQQAFSLAGATRIELISKVLETFILPIKLSTYLNGATSPTRTENLRFTRALHCHCANVAYGGQYRIQTDDLLCARQAFYQLN